MSEAVADPIVALIRVAGRGLGSPVSSASTMAAMTRRTSGGRRRGGKGAALQLLDAGSWKGERDAWWF